MRDRDRLVGPGTLEIGDRVLRDDDAVHCRGDTQTDRDESCCVMMTNDFPSRGLLRGEEDAVYCCYYNYCCCYTHCGGDSCDCDCYAIHDVAVDAHCGDGVVVDVHRDWVNHDDLVHDVHVWVDGVHDDRDCLLLPCSVVASSTFSGTF